MKTHSSTTPSWQLLQAFSWTDFVVPETRAAVINASGRNRRIGHWNRYIVTSFSLVVSISGTLQCRAWRIKVPALSGMQDPWCTTCHGCFILDCVEGPLGTAFRVPVYLLLRRAA
jgi:hypothetical protein